MKNTILGISIISTYTLAQQPLLISEEYNKNLVLNTSFHIKNNENPIIKRNLAINQAEILDSNLKKILNKKKNNEVLLVEILLNSIMQEKGYTNEDVKASLFNGIVDNLSINSMFPKNYISLSSDEQLNEIQEIFFKNSKDINKQRILKIENIMNNIISEINIKKIIRFNKKSGYLLAKISKKDILKLSKLSKNILHIGLPKKDKNTIVSAVYSGMDMDTTPFPFSDYGGQSVGIYMSEAGTENSRVCFKESRVTPIEGLMGFNNNAHFQYEIGNYITDIGHASIPHHPDLVAQSLRASSPYSDIYCSNNRFSVPSSWENDIQVVNYSWGNGDGTSSSWHIYDSLNDNHVYNDNIQVFKSAGNESGYVTNGARSHNILTVGGYNDMDSNGHEKMYSQSNWKNPSTGATKPEILAPAVDINLAGFSHKNGTSIASPLATGMAASNISLMGNFMKKRPALIKASMLAMATRTNIYDNGSTKRDKATAIQWNPNGWYQWGDWSNESVGGGWKKIGTYNVNRYGYVKVGFSWLNRHEICDGKIDGNSYSGAPSNHLCMDLDLAIVTPSGNIKYFTSRNQNWESGLIFDHDGEYKAYIRKVNNYYETDSNGNTHKNRIKFGFRIAYVDNM